MRSFGEVSHGVDAEPNAEEHYWKNTDRLPAIWNSDRRVFVLTRREQVHEVAELLGEEPRLLFRDRKRVVLVNFPSGDGPVGGTGDGS